MISWTEIRTASIIRFHHGHSGRRNTLTDENASHPIRCVRCRDTKANQNPRQHVGTVSMAPSPKPRSIANSDKGSDAKTTAMAATTRTMRLAIGTVPPCRSKCTSSYRGCVSRGQDGILLAFPGNFAGSARHYRFIHDTIADYNLLCG